MRKIVENAIAWNSSEHTFPQTSHSGKWGLREGHLPHVGDAMELVNEAWGKTKSSTILKCWIKSNCLSESQIELALSYCTNEVATGNDNSTDSAIQEHEAQALYDALQSLAYTTSV